MSVTCNLCENQNKPKANWINDLRFTHWNKCGALRLLQPKIKVHTLRVGLFTSSNEHFEYGYLHSNELEALFLFLKNSFVLNLLVIYYWFCVFHNR